jgi:glutaredoxin
MKKVVFYGLSTCGWCRKTKRFLDANGVDYELIYVDHLAGAEREQILSEVGRWNPRRSFPTIVIDDTTVVIGFQEAQLRQVLGL